jgi:hypothetical protein
VGPTFVGSITLFVEVRNMQPRKISPAVPLIYNFNILGLCPGA